MVEETRRLMELTANEGDEGARILSVRKQTGDAGSADMAPGGAKDRSAE